MSVKASLSTDQSAEHDRLARMLDIYARSLAGAMMLFGFYHWAVIFGLLADTGGTFEAMPAAWQVATIHFAVFDLVAAVGLWMRVAWGNVVWIYAALSEVVLHTIFYEKFAFDFLLVAFHLITIATFAVLALFAYRAGRPR